MVKTADPSERILVEVAGAVAPGAKIVVYFAPNTDAGFLAAIMTAIHDIHNKPTVISISWGAPESDWTMQALQAMDQAFQDAAALGVTVCCASGDDGSSDRVKELETRGQRQLRTLTTSLGKENAELFQRLEKVHTEGVRTSEANMLDIRSQFSTNGASLVATWAHPGFSEGRIATPHTIGWLTPYYATLHGSDSSVDWQGYNPRTFDLWDSVSGAGSGLFGSCFPDRKKRWYE
jgi:hypothetical protein